MSLFVERRRAFWARMDRNYRHKYERICTHPHFTTIDLSEETVVRAHSGVACRDSSRDSSRHSALLVGIFVALTDSRDSHSIQALSPYLERFSHRCVMLEDMHSKPHENLYAYLNDTYTDVLATYECAQLAAIRDQCPNIRNAHVIPHHIDTDLYRDRGLPKRYDVLLYGNVHPATYPFRLRLRNLLRQSPFQVKILDDPGSETFDPTCCGESLAKLINQSWISIATPSKHDYLLAKYFEISACGSVLAGKMATQGSTLWRDDYVPLMEDMSDHEIQARIANALLSKDALHNMSRVVGERIRLKYSLDGYADKVAAVMDKIQAPTRRCSASA